MGKSTLLPHLYLAEEMGTLLGQPPGLLTRLVRSRIHPPYVWKPPWREPRWPLSTVPQWLQILRSLDLSSLPENPPPLERPVDVFERLDEPTQAELTVAEKICAAMQGRRRA